MEPITSVTVTPRVEINGELRSVKVISTSYNEKTGYRQLLIEIPLTVEDNIVSELEFSNDAVSLLKQIAKNTGATAGRLRSIEEKTSGANQKEN